MYEGSKVMFFRDFSAAVKCNARDSMMLRNVEGCWRSVLPAMLRVTHNGNVKVFESPDQALAFVNSLG